MDKLKKVILFFSLFLCVGAQVVSNQHDINPIHPSTTVVFIVLSIMFLLTLLTVAYAKFCHRLEVQDPGGIVRSEPRFSGIDKTIIESLPFFRFSSLKGSKEGLECAVCLSLFEEMETLRLLPKCQHAFHINCIDKWLENHSSCPLCRYKFDAGDLKGSSHTNSFRNMITYVEEPSLEFFIERETNEGRSSRFILSNAVQKLVKGEREESLIQDGRNERKVVHNLRHKIIVSDVMSKSCWSDVNSSDFMSLNSEMLNLISSKRFSSLETNSGRFTDELSANEQILMIKEDMERKRLYEPKVGIAETSNSCSSSNIAMSKFLDPSEKRSMSEITNISRFREFNPRSGVNISTTSANMENADRVRKIWLPIAKRTIRWFAGRESSSDAIKHMVNV